MKTIRFNCFETNSSSTHALTIGFPLEFPKPEQKFITDQRFNLHESDFQNSMYEKANFFLSYAFVLGNVDHFNRVVSVIKDFCGVNVEAYIEKWNADTRTRDTIEITPESFKSLLLYSLETDEDLLEELYEEEMFSYMIGDYGHSSVRDIVETVEPIISDYDKLQQVIFSNLSIFEEHHYFDG